MRGLWLAGLLGCVWQADGGLWARADPPPRGTLGGQAAFHGRGHAHDHWHAHRGHGLGRVSTVWWFVDVPRTRWLTRSGYSLGSIPYIPYYGGGLFSLSDYGGAYFYPGIYPCVPWVYEPFLYGGPVVYPPVIMPGEILFGPAAVQRFMGVGPPAMPAPSVVPRAEGGLRGEGRARADQAQGEPAPRPETPAHAKETAERLLGIGDGYFAQEKYAEALDRYRRAAQAARGLADPWFRQGFALLALGRYDAAAKAFRTALRLDARWVGSGFALQRLYGNAAAMDAHLEALAQTAELQPENPELLFLVGVFLYFSGQPDRSEPFFQRAEQLTRGDKSHLRAFLDRQ